MLAFFARRKRQSLLASCGRRELSEAFTVCISPGPTLRDHLADPMRSPRGMSTTANAGDRFLHFSKLVSMVRESYPLA
jgi:hypothetical protein